MDQEKKPLNVLSEKSIQDLRQIAQSLGLDVKEKMTKSDLIDLISTKNLNADIKGTEAGVFEGVNLDSLKLVDLREVAEKLGIDAPYKYRKKELREEIDKALQEQIKLENLSLVELRDLAKEKNIEDYYKYKKPDLLRLIKSKQGQDDDPVEEAEDDHEYEDEEDQVEILGPRPSINSDIDTEDLSDNATDLLESMDDFNYVSGILEVLVDGYGFLRRDNYLSSDGDVYVSPSQIRKFRLKTGDKVVGVTKPPSNSEKFNAIIYIKSVNDRDPKYISRRPSFDELTPIYPKERLTLEAGKNPLALRMLDLLSPIGKGQRGLIVSQPKSGKTTLLKMIAKSIEEKYPDSHLIVLLIDERPEEVTDMQRSVAGEVVYSTFDEQAKNHIKVAEMVIERAKRLVESKEDVIILLDSITRLARAYNLVTPPSGKTLSGGLDPLSLYKPKKFFGAARNIEEGGSLTILATALVETGSRMDDIIYEEFKGTGNMEVHLDRKLSEKRIFPAIDIYKSGTRKEELLLNEDEYKLATSIRRIMGELSTADVTESILKLMDETASNNEFIAMAEKNNIFI